jgi:hypothetical protein
VVGSGVKRDALGREQGREAQVLIARTNLEYAMAAPAIEREMLKQAMKEALAETLVEQRGMLREVIAEIIEEVALSEAVDQGRKTERADRDEIFGILEGRV